MEEERSREVLPVVALLENYIESGDGKALQLAQDLLKEYSDECTRRLEMQNGRISE